MLENDNVGTGGVDELDVLKLYVALYNGQLSTFRGAGVNERLTIDDLEYVEGCWPCFADFWKPHLSLLGGRSSRRTDVPRREKVT